MIDNIIKNESRNKPISDLKIQRKLSDLNVKISRRTVNKYRRELNIKNSYNRIFSEKWVISWETEWSNHNNKKIW